MTAVWASYQIRKIVCCACAGNARNVFPTTDFKGKHWLAIPACTTTRASCTCRDACRDRKPTVAGKTFLAFPVYAQPAILRFWQEAYGACTTSFAFMSRTRPWCYILLKHLIPSPFPTVLALVHVFERYGFVVICYFTSSVLVYLLIWQVFQTKHLV